LLAGGRAYTTPDPLIETVQHGRGLAEPKITLPSMKVAAHVANHFLDPILKERLFGLTNGEGNHGEDVKEYYFYLDSIRAHFYLLPLGRFEEALQDSESVVRSL
jgi:hypothetical protein